MFQQVQEIMKETPNLRWNAFVAAKNVGHKHVLRRDSRIQFEKKIKKILCHGLPSHSPQIYHPVQFYLEEVSLYYIVIVLNY